MSATLTAPAATQLLGPDDLVAVGAILDASLGAGFMGVGELAAYALDPFSERQFGIVATGPDAGAPIGVALVDVPDNMADFRTMMPDEHAADRVLGLFGPLHRTISRIGLLRTVAVEPDARQRGVASLLVTRAVDGLWEAGADRVICIGWVRDGTCAVQGALTRAGFAPVGHLPHFWLEDSLERGYACPDCPNGHCRCGAVVFAA